MADVSTDFNFRPLNDLQRWSLTEQALWMTLRKEVQVIQKEETEFLFPLISDTTPLGRDLLAFCQDRFRDYGHPDFPMRLRWIQLQAFPVRLHNGDAISEESLFAPQTTCLLVLDLPLQTPPEVPVRHSCRNIFTEWSRSSHWSSTGKFSLINPEDEDFRFCVVWESTRHPDQRIQFQLFPVIRMLRLPVSYPASGFGIKNWWCGTQEIAWRSSVEVNSLGYPGWREFLRALIKCESHQLPELRFGWPFWKYQAMLHRFLANISARVWKQHTLVDLMSLFFRSEKNVMFRFHEAQDLLDHFSGCTCLKPLSSFDPLVQPPSPPSMLSVGRDTNSNTGPPFSSSLADCSICMSRPINVILIPCGHLCLCDQCAEKVSQCCLCRRTITSRQLVYYSPPE